ncbi:MAG: hypothetical protein FD126_1304 [Elusimicrobia bacterium]|nr:MAG: hypothetical protein FD126_1304 [Elusimicrobiota bacterium]
MIKFAIASILAALLAGPASAAAPTQMTYQGRLRESSAPVTGSRQVNIYLCDAPAAGTCTPTGEQTVTVTNSLFRTVFPVPSSVNLQSGTWYLEVRLGAGGTTTLAPREELTASPYSMVAGTATAVVDGVISSGKIADGAVVSGKLGVNSIVTVNIQDGVVSSAKIADGAVSSGKILDGGVASGKLAVNAIVAVNIQDGAVTSAKLADGAVSSGKIADGGVVSGKLGAAAVLTANIQDGAVTSAKLAEGSVSSGKIADGGVATGKLADLSVATIKLQDSAVTFAKLADGAVASDKIQAGGIASGKLAANAVLSSSILDGAVTTAKIGGGAVTTAKFAAEAFGPWQFLGRVKLGGAAGSISVPVASVTYYKVIVYISGKSASNVTGLQFNGNTAANYAYNFSVNSAAPTTASGVTQIQLNSAGSIPEYFTFEMASLGGITIVSGLGTGAAGAAPDLVHFSGKASFAGINSIDLLGNGANLQINSEVIVYGRN